MASSQITHQDERDAIIVAKKLNYVAIPGGIGLVCYAGLYWQKSPVIIGMGLLVSLASLLLGALVGFLFGIPKSNDPQRKTVHGLTSDSPDGAENLAQTVGGGIRRNTNIEEISDWLTKIIVGLGIYELKNVPTLVQRLARFLGSGFDMVPGAGTLAVILAVSFGSAGFLLGYLLTVLFIAKALTRIDSSNRAEVNMKEDATTAQLMDSILQSTGRGDPNNVREQILALADKYVTERASRPAGDERTMVMENITRELRKLALVGYPLLKTLSESDSPGGRLAATAFLQIKPNKDYIDWFISKLPMETPFIQYQMALALQAALRSLSGLDQDDLKKKIGECLKAVRKGSDEFRVLQNVLNQLG